MTAKVILNPYAARWKAGEQRAAMEEALRAAGVDFEVVATEEPRQGIRLAREATEAGFDPIIAAGGDGSIHEVVNGMMMAVGDGEPPNFGVMPLGTANDLVDNLGMPRELEAAAAVIGAGHTRAIDLCEVNGHFFVNNAGIGLEPYVTSVQARMTRVGGIVRYLLATLTAIAHNPQWRMEMAWEGGGYEGPVTLVSVGNLPRTGGIFYTVPHADGFDGKLSFVYGHIPTRLGILRVLPKTMQADKGSYVEHPAVHEGESDWLRVRVRPPSPAHADGELFDLEATELNYRVHAARLPLLYAAG